MEDTDPILQGFNVQPLPTIGGEINNAVYSSAFGFLVDTMSAYVVKSSQNGVYTYQTQNGPATVNLANLSTIQRANYVFGTPQTIWGRFYFPGVSSVDFYDGTSLINNVTQAQIISSLRAPNNTFAWTEYAGADLYISALCNSISNRPPVCSEPAVAELAARL